MTRKKERDTLVALWEPIKIRYLFHYQLDLVMPDIVFPGSADVKPVENLTNCLPVYFRPFQLRESVAIGVVVRDDDSQTPLGRHL